MPTNITNKYEAIITFPLSGTNLKRQFADFLPAFRATRARYLARAFLGDAAPYELREAILSILCRIAQYRDCSR